MQHDGPPFLVSHSDVGFREKVGNLSLPGRFDPGVDVVALESGQAQPPHLLPQPLGVGLRTGQEEPAVLGIAGDLPAGPAVGALEVFPRADAVKDVGRAGSPRMQGLQHSGELPVVSVPGQGGDPAAGVHVVVAPDVGVGVENPVGQEGCQFPFKEVAVFGLDERQRSCRECLGLSPGTRSGLGARRGKR